jgi:T-complex protein 1 subunit zeta
MVTVVNSKADVLKASQALAVNLNAAKGLQEVMKTNLGPRGTLKMLVGGAGQIKITKDGNALLGEMQIQHPTACMIARAATAQDDITGDGTTSSVMFIGELMKLSELSLGDGLHPRLIAEGFDIAREETMKFLDGFKITLENPLEDRERLVCVARTSLRTKIQVSIADQMAEVAVDAVRCIKRPNEPLDLHMVEILHMKQKLINDTRLIKGLVMDHGSRHPDMPKRLENCYILTCNVSLEYEKSEVNAGFFYSSSEQRDNLVASERKFTDEKVKKIIELKRKVCTEENKKSFVLINQKGIDPPSLEMLARENIIALRRAKRRNMERLPLTCGGNAVNSVDDLDEDDLGYADLVYEQTLEDEKYTFIEGVKNPHSCTVLIKGSNDHGIAQMKDALKDGLRSVLNAVEDEAVVPGAGAFEVAAHVHLEEFKKTVSGKPRLGVQIFSNALLITPKTLLENSGLDVQDKLLSVVAEREAKMKPVGVSVATGDPIDPVMEGIWDNYNVKKQTMGLAPVLAEQLLLVDEVIRAGKQMGRGGDGPNYG